MESEPLVPLYLFYIAYFKLPCTKGICRNTCIAFRRWNFFFYPRGLNLIRRIYNQSTRGTWWARKYRARFFWMKQSLRVGEEERGEESSRIWSIYFVSSAFLSSLISWILTNFWNTENAKFISEGNVKPRMVIGMNVGVQLVRGGIKIWVQISFAPRHWPFPLLERGHEIYCSNWNTPGSKKECY